MQSNQQYQSLIEMGCSPILSEAAIKNTKSQDLSAILDWISEHSEQEQKWKLWLSQNQSTGEKQETLPQGSQSIDTLVNKELSQALQKLGHSKNLSQKALLFSGNTSVEKAEAWIEDHKYDLDLEQEVFVTGQAENQSSLTPEEAKQKLKELTDKAREKRLKREEEEAKQREKNRVRYGKQMIEAKRIAEQQALKRQVELDKIQKRKDEEYKQKLLQQMRAERNAKLGLKEEVKPGSTPVAAKKEVKYSRLEQLQIQCQQVKVGMHAYPEKAKTFFQTANIYVTNIIKNNGEEKYRKINKQNKAFQSRIVETFGGVQTLEVIGYQEDGGFLVIKNFDLKELQNVSALLQRYTSYYY